MFSINVLCVDTVSRSIDPKLKPKEEELECSLCDLIIVFSVINIH